MKRILFATVSLIACAVVVYISASAQSKISSTEQSKFSADQQKNDDVKIAVPIANIPGSFRGMGENVLHDPGKTLAPIMNKLRGIRKNYLKNNMLEKDFEAPQSNDTLHIIHIGDSHVRGHVYPHALRDLLSESFGSIAYKDFGINGATCNSYLNSRTMQQVCTYTLEQEDNPLISQSDDNQILHRGLIAKHHKPDLIIVSFGTNESYGRYYNSDEHYKQIDDLVKALNEAFPGTPLLLTTPAGCYKAHRSSYKVRVPISSRHSKHGRKSRRYKTVTRTSTTYSENPFNAPCAATIVKYAKDNNLAYWDLYTISGGRENACRNWTSARLMRADHVHFLPEGYTLQGQLLYCALIKEYNK
ncbi:MAG: SGNH/GDSL hydrolase family protein [Bacteroidales bacterium]|jgi:lysophospholipase L1-like esterase|nr:SGNH/GDSL hydrolase family protein [Bacteroidales bacterium]MCI1733450.1 SGNH/GDSL hydrolase family protein [Bacteroidales bacterium]